LPNSILNGFRDFRDQISHEGKYDYKMKRDRVSPFDYTTRYDHNSLRKARKSILWDDDWKKATQATLSIFNELKLLGGNQIIVDYGGGIGRITRGLLENSDSRVILVDRSPEMRDHAMKYIPEKLNKNSRLTIWSDSEFMEQSSDIKGGIDLILFIESLQHIPEPILRDIFPKIISCLSSTGRVFVLGNKDLDVDEQARRHHTLIGDFLKKHVEVIREEVWEKWERGGRIFCFKYPRFSFLCGKLAATNGNRRL